MNNLSPGEYCSSTGRVTFWDCKRKCGQINENIPFNISTALFDPRTNDEVIFCQIKTRKGHRAINVKKLSGAAQGKKRRAFQPNPSRRLVLKGIRPAVEIRRETPPSFLSNFDVPDFIERAIRQGQG